MILLVSLAHSLVSLQPIGYINLDVAKQGVKEEEFSVFLSTTRESVDREHRR